MTGRIIKKWMSLLLAVTMLISMASLNVSASETDKTYKAYDASRHRKVISKNGITDSEWSLCMDDHKKSPGTSNEATGEYSKNENATKYTYNSNGGKGDFQKIKRMLFYKLKHPELNYTVLQNEYYYQQDNKANKRQYDTNYSQYPQFNVQKQTLRAFAEDSSHDAEINSKMEVFIYKAKNPSMQNLISAKLKELPPPPPSTPPTKVKFSKKALTEKGEELAGATIKLTKEDGSLVEEWVTDGTVKEFELKDGKYTFTEISAPAKYQVATAISFEVKDSKVKVKGTKVSGNAIVMVDQLKEIPKTDITATKKWEGGPSEKPTVWFKLYRNIEAEEAKPVEELFEQPLNNGDTSVTWRGLPKTNDEGKEYIYSVKEGEVKEGVFTEKAPDNYIKTENGLTVTNKYSSPKIDITGKKVWENEGEKPTIKLQLFKNGQAEGNPVELKDGKTEHIWKNLDKTDDNGKEYVYTVKEVDEVNGHIKIGNTWYKVTYEGNTQTGFTIKNKKLPPYTPMISPTRDIKVVKNWELLGTEKPIEKIEVEIYQNDNPTGKKLELNTSNNWSGEFKKLPVSKELGTEEYKYTIKEIGETSNSIKLNGKWFKVTYEGSMKDGFKITNKEQPPLTPMVPPTRDIKVTKDWKDSSGNNLDAPVDKIKVELYKDGVATGNIKELTKDNNWTVTFEKLKVYESIENPAIHKYTVKEVGENKNSIKIGNAWYKVTYEGDAQKGFVVKNKKLPPLTPMEPPTREVKVIKEWKDSSGNNLDAPVDKIKVELYKDGVATGKKLELTKDNNWTGEFKNLEVADGLGGTNYYQYTVKEIGETTGSIKFDGKWFKVSYSGNMKDGFTITNQKEKPWTPMEPPIREVKVTKLWKDHKGNTITAPTEKITVELYKDGNPTGKTLELNASNNWSGVFKNLEVANGLGSIDYYKYTVKEVGEDSNAIKFDGKQYKVVYGGSMKDGLTITNEKETPPAPSTPPNTEKPKVPNTSTNNSLPKTGDGANLSLYAWLMFASGSLLILLGIRKRKHAK